MSWYNRAQDEGEVHEDYTSKMLEEAIERVESNPPPGGSMSKPRPGWGTWRELHGKYPPEVVKAKVVKTRKPHQCALCLEGVKYPENFPPLAAGSQVYCISVKRPPGIHVNYYFCTQHSTPPAPALEFVRKREGIIE